MPLTDAEFHAQTRVVLDRIEAQLDAWLEADVVDIDGRRSGGLLEMSLPGPGAGSKIVINTQPPLHELWMAARAGGYHFRLADDGVWRDTREGQEFHELLSRLASEQAGVSLKFRPG